MILKVYFTLPISIRDINYNYSLGNQRRKGISSFQKSKQKFYICKTYKGAPTIREDSTT